MTLRQARQTQKTVRAGRILSFNSQKLSAGRSSVNLEYFFRFQTSFFNNLLVDIRKLYQL